MTMRDENDLKWLNDHVEAFSDGELSPEELRRFNAEALSHAQIWNEVALSNQIRGALHSMPDESCPDFVSKNIMAHVHRDIRTSIWQRVQSFYLNFNAGLFKPAIAVAVLILAVVTSTQIGNSSSKTTSDVAQALDDVKWTLAYLSVAGKTTASAVKEDVIEPHVVGPMSRSLSTKF